MMKLARACLRVQNAAELEAFYCSLLGMRRLGSADAPAFGYDPAQCLLELDEGKFAPYTASSDDLYWKIGITVKNLDSAVAYLRASGYEVSAPRQFRDIGYLCHLHDPAGFVIELLQQGFEGNEGPSGDGHAIGGQATLAHVTLRVCDIAATRRYCEGQLGMRLMSIQPVRDLGFTLYFYAWSDEVLPNEDLEAVENREWLWLRPYTLLELQHLESSDQIKAPDVRAAGFAGIGVENDVGDLRYLSFQSFLSL
ncbi:MAG: VOC family protein [Aestuariivirgaceae bacterium]